MATLVLPDNLYHAYGALQRYDVTPGEASIDRLLTEPSTNKPRI